MASTARSLMVLASVSLLLACAFGAEARVQRKPEVVKVNRRLLSSSDWAKPSVETANKMAGWEATPQEQSAADAIERRIGAATTLDAGARKLLSFFGRHNGRFGHTNFLAGHFRQTGQVNMPDVTTGAVSQGQADVEDQEATQERDAESDAADGSDSARKLLSFFGRHNAHHSNFLAGRFRQTGQVNMRDVTTGAVSQGQADVEDQEAMQERDAESDASEGPARKLLSTFAAVKPTVAFDKAFARVGGAITNQESNAEDEIDAAELTAAGMDRPW